MKLSVKLKYIKQKATTSLSLAEEARGKVAQGSFQDGDSLDSILNASPSESSPRQAKPIDPHSSRCIAANYSVFLTNSMLGQCHAEYGKAAVVSYSNNGTLPKFSKYSGVLEWSNCVYLWINLGATNGKTNASTSADQFTYDNTFLAEGRSIVWFGGSKMTQGLSIHRSQVYQLSAYKQCLLSYNNATESPVVRRFLRSRSAASSSGSDGSEAAPDSRVTGDVAGEESPGVTQDPNPVLLFVRLPGEGYCCLGRLRMASANLTRHPLVVHWELLDHAALLSGPNQDKFRAILQASPMRQRRCTRVVNVWSR